MSIKAIDAVSRVRPANSTSKLVLLALADNADDEGFVHIAQAHLAKSCGLARETVNRHLKRLEEQGHIRSKQLYGFDGSIGNKAYWLTAMDMEGV